MRESHQKKVLFVATVDSHISHFHLPYLQMFKKAGWETHVATNSAAKLPFTDRKHKISFERSPFRANNLRAITQMRRLLAREHFDIIHCHTPMGAAVTRIAAKQARRNGTRIIYTAHGFHFFDGAPLLNWLIFYPVEKYLAKFTDTLITINQEDYQRAKRKFSKRCSDIQYVPGVGVDPSKFQTKISTQEARKLRASLGLSEQDFVMIFPARLDKNKNQAFLIQATAKLITKHPDIHLVLPGPDELNGEYQRLAAELNASANIHFLGSRNDIPDLLKISDLAVSSSYREGLPVNIIEALFAELPIVALQCRGMQDLLSQNPNATIIKSGDMDSFIQAVIRVKNNPRNKARKSNLNIFTTSHITNIMSNIYFKGSATGETV